MPSLLLRAFAIMLCLLAAGLSLAHGQTVKNIRVQNPNEGEVTITYDLEGEPGSQFEVTVYLLREGDPNFRLKLTNAQGDIGRGRSAGFARRIVWNVFADYPEAVGGQQYRFEFEVTRHLPLPRLHGISPSSAKQGETLTLQLGGSNFVAGATTVDAGQGIIVNFVEVRSATLMLANITVAEDVSTGKRSVRVTNDKAKGDASEPRTLTIEGSGGIPWYYYAAGGVVVTGAIVYFATRTKDEDIIVTTTPLPDPPTMP